MPSYLDPTRAAALEGMQGGGAPMGQPPPMGGAMPPPQGAAPGGQENEVAMYLALAFDALVRTGATPENGAAIQQFLESLKQLLSGAVPQPGSPQGQVAGAPAGPPPGGPPPMAAMPQREVMPQGNIPLPPR